MNPRVYVVQHQENEVMCGSSQEKAVASDKSTIFKSTQPALSLCSAMILQAMRPSNHRYCDMMDWEGAKEKSSGGGVPGV
jgi:hypothetical protein